MPRQVNQQGTYQVGRSIFSLLLLLLIVSAADAQFKPCNESEAAGELIAGEPDENHKPLRIFEMPAAEFPEDARQKGTFGTVTLKVRFLAGGTIGKIIVVDGLPNGLTEEAVKAARKIRFLPARLHGRLVNTAETVEYHFPEPGRCGSIDDLALFKLNPKI